MSCVEPVCVRLFLYFLNIWCLFAVWLQSTKKDFTSLSAVLRPPEDCNQITYIDILFIYACLLLILTQSYLIYKIMFRLVGGGGDKSSNANKRSRRWIQESMKQLEIPNPTRSLLFSNSQFCCFSPGQRTSAFFSPRRGWERASERDLVSALYVFVLWRKSHSFDRSIDPLFSRFPLANCCEYFRLWFLFLNNNTACMHAIYNFIPFSFE